MSFQNKGINTPKLQVYLPLLFALVLGIGMLLGIKMNQQIRPSFTPETAKNPIGVVEEVFNYVEEKYVDTVNSSLLAEVAVKEALQELDPHSSYIAPKELPKVQENMQGNFDGIGIEFSIVKDTIMVVAPISGGPSAKMGILAGDKIIQIKDSLVAGIGITNEQVMKKLKGPKGTKVKVSIYRKGYPKLFDFDIKRAKIPIVSVDVGYMIDNQVGYIKMNRFSATTDTEINTQLKKLKEKGMEKLILDLRQNPGGYLDVAVNIADEFIDGRNLLVYTKGRNHKRNDFNAKYPGVFEEGDLVVLIDEGSASASEIVAGAVQDWDRGKIMGRRSFGKGLVQEQDLLRAGGALRLTVARYYTPSGRCIQKPYEEGSDAYDKDIQERIRNGELYDADSAFANIPDSLQYRTLKENRLVYGGGGITPDVFIPIDTSKNEAFALNARRAVPEFVYDYFGNNQDKFRQYASFSNFNKNFQINSELFKQFENHLRQSLDSLHVDLLQRDKKELKTSIKAHIARHLWNSDGYYPIIHEMDHTLQKAYEEIKRG